MTFQELLEKLANANVDASRLRLACRDLNPNLVFSKLIEWNDYMFWLDYFQANRN